MIFIATLLFNTNSRDNLKNKLNFSKWLEYNAEFLIDLFINFSLLRKYGGGPELLNAHSFLSQNGKQTILDKEKVQKYSLYIRDEIIKSISLEGEINPEIIYEYDYSVLTAKWQKNNDTLLRIVSAKNYLLPLLQFRINHCVGKGKGLLPTGSFKLFLADKCKLDRLAFIKDKIK